MSVYQNHVCLPLTLTKFKIKQAIINKCGVAVAADPPAVARGTKRDTIGSDTFPWPLTSLYVHRHTKGCPDTFHLLLILLPLYQHPEM